MELPDGLEVIELDSFRESGIKNAAFPASLRTIASAAFAGCMSLKTVEFAEGLKIIGTDECADNDELPCGVF